MAMPGIHAFWTRGTLFAIPGRRTPHTISGPFVLRPKVSFGQLMANSDAPPSVSR